MINNMSEDNEIRNGLGANSTNNDYRQFHILDEVTNESDSNNNSELSDDSDIPDDEIDQLLEDALKNTKKRTAEQAGLGVFFVRLLKQFLGGVCFCRCETGKSIWRAR